MNTQAKAMASLHKFHPTFDHDNDDHCQLGGWGRSDGVPPIAMPAPVAHRSAGLFDHRHGWEERDGGQQHQQGPAHASDAQDGLISAIGGSATAAGESSAVTGLVENFAEDRGGYSIAMGEAIFQASAHSSEPGGAVAAASTFLDVSGADFIFEHEIGQSKQGLNDAWARSELDYLSIDIHGWSPRQGPIVIEVDHPFGHLQPSGQELPLGNFAQVLAMSEAHGANTISATLTNALTVENQFSFVNAMGMVTL
jgi:hypothetical protein